MAKTEHFRHAPGEYQHPEAIRATPQKLFFFAIAAHSPRAMRKLRALCVVAEQFGPNSLELQREVQAWAKKHNLVDANGKAPRWIWANAKRAVEAWVKFPHISGFPAFAPAVTSSVTGDQEIAPGISWDPSENTRTQFEKWHKSKGRRLTTAIRSRLDAVEHLARQCGALRPPRGWAQEHYAWAVRVLCNGDTPSALARPDTLSTVEKAVKRVLDAVGLHRSVPRGRPRSRA